MVRCKWRFLARLMCLSPWWVQLRSTLEQRRSAWTDTVGHGTGLASGKQELIPAFLNKKGIQVFSPAMPNVVI